MAYTTIDDPSAHFQVGLLTGNAGLISLTNDGNSDLQPDMLWHKERGGTQPHTIRDTSRGIDKFVYILTNAEGTNSYFTSFNTDGYTINSTDNEVNGSGDTYASWQWKANGGSTSSNTTGDITSTVQTNTTAGFSIGTYTGDADNTSSVGHGLGATPGLVILKSRTGTHSWIVWHQSLTATSAYALDLENSDAQANNVSYFHDTAPDANTFHPGDGGASNGSGTATLFYAWKEIQGYSKFGGYTGNGNADGTFVYLGFRPALIIIKCTSTASTDWVMYSHNIDVNPIGSASGTLYPSLSDAASSAGGIDFLSNGFKARSTNGYNNGSSRTYVYAAFAHQPFVTSGGVPCTAF